jgi:hypothetical protein
MPLAGVPVDDSDLQDMKARAQRGWGHKTDPASRRIIGGGNLSPIQQEDGKGPVRDGMGQIDIDPLGRAGKDGPVIEGEPGLQRGRSAFEKILPGRRPGR